MQRSVGALPFCTSAPQVVSDCALCALEEPGRAAAAVTTRAPAEEHHDIAGFGLSAADMITRGCGDNRAQLHALGDEAG